MIQIFFILLSIVSCLSQSPEVVLRRDDPVVLSSYHVSTNVDSRLMTTSIHMIFENNQSCSSSYALTLQLPRDAKVTDLLMDLSDGCKLGSQVKTIDDAESDFEEFVAEGKAAAILTAWDMSKYKLDVSIPPNGVTSVTLKYQELLLQKLDEVSFQVPMFPGIAVDDLQVDISVEDLRGVREFVSDFSDEAIEIRVGDANVTMHYEQRGVSEDSTLPTLFPVHFRPGDPAENGLFLSDGECFTHMFKPALLLQTLGPMNRHIVFVIDVSGSMNGSKLDDAKRAFAAMIESLDENDTLTIQSFSDKGTESKRGPFSATSENRANAKRFVENLSTISSTNLNDAILDGIGYVEDAPESAASIVVLMTDGMGMTRPAIVARNVRGRNKVGKVKIYSIAFGADADLKLLQAIAIQNGGSAVRIYEGFNDASDQMELFYKQQLGSILVSDVKLSYDSEEVDILDSTASQIPIFAGGSEIVVRGKMKSFTTMDTSRGLKTIMSANSAQGPFETEFLADHIVIPQNTGVSDCRQSFAQARIAELLEYRDASKSIGNDILIGTDVTRSSGNTLNFQEQAIELALEAGLVWPELTALITVDNKNCQQNTSDVCYDGEGRADFRNDDNVFFEKDYGGAHKAFISSGPTRYGWSYCFHLSLSVFTILSSMMLSF